MPLLEEPPPAAHPAPPPLAVPSLSPAKLHPWTPSPATAIATAILSDHLTDTPEAASPILPRAFALASSDERSCSTESAATTNPSSLASDSQAASCSEHDGRSGLNQGASALSTMTLRAALLDVASTRSDLGDSDTQASALPYLVSSPAATSFGSLVKPSPVPPLSAFDDTIACDSSRLPFSSRATSPFAAPPSLPLFSSSNSDSAVPTSTRSESATLKPLPPLPPSRSKRVATPIKPWELVRLLERSEGLGRRQEAPLLVDTRGLAAFLGADGRLRGSINCAFPTGNVSNFALSSFITTELGKSLYTAMSPSSSSSSTRPIVVIDDKLDSRAREALNPGAVLLSVLERKEGGEGSGTVYYLDQPLSEAAKREEALRRWVVLGESDDELVTLMSPSNPTPRLPFSFPHGPTRLTALAPPHPLSSLPVPSVPVAAPSPATPLPPVILPPLLSPRASHSTARRQRPPPPKLRRIDTSENLLATYAKPGTSSASATSGIAARRNRSQSPAPRLHVNVQAAQLGVTPTGGGKPVSLHEMCHLQSKSPSAMATRFREAELFPPPSSASRSTSRSSSSSSTRAALLGALDADARPQTPDEQFDPDVRPPFHPSTILPGFLFLGQEPTCPADLDELERLGVKQVLNLAVECEDKDDEVKNRFGRYGWLPMTDSVEETGVQEKLDEACGILADAQLQSKPVYVHCRAGKSRSVTIVLAYLVYHNHWSLKRAYSYVAERREGISPNLGFMAELMAFEERHRGTRSHGVFGSKTGFTPDRATHPTHRFQRSQTAAASYFTGSPPSAPGHSSDDSAAEASSCSAPLLERTLSDQGGASSGLASTLYTTSRAARAIRESMPPPSRVREGTGSAKNEERGATPPEVMLRERARGGGEVERNREVRAADGTWVEARREARSETGEIDRRASRAGLESTAITSFG
ncbi:hypothetical protein JCM5296_003001 [Sporobolomyces johnsonii]